MASDTRPPCFDRCAQPPGQHRRRNWPSRAGLAGLMLTAAWPGAAAAAIFDVTTTADSGPGSLRAAVSAAGSGDTVRFLTGGTITLASELPIITKNLTIDGNGFNPAISGAGSFRPFIIGDAGTTGSTYSVTIANLSIVNAVAQGGTGYSSGAGAGLGGAVFVSSNGQLTLANVAIANTRAIGGSWAANPGEAAGGGGMGGSTPFAVTPGGGGGLLVGSNGSPSTGNGGGPNGGAASTIPSGSTAPANAGAGGFGSGGGGAAADNSAATGGAGGFGGGGGASNNGGGNSRAGNGGFGGGGGSAGHSGTFTATGGSGGYGGGGGGAYSSSGTAIAGLGGFGGGNGTPGVDANGLGGGGGLGAGGAIFVQNGGTLTIQGNTSQSGGTATGGTGNTASNGGQAAGAGLFLQGSGTMAFAPALGATVTIANAISDETGFLAAHPGYTPPAGFVAGSWGLAMNGQGTLVLNGASTLGSPLTINAGTVVVNGSITDPIVNAGGTLAGTGTVDATTVNSGGTLAPGAVGGIGTLTINGNLVFNAGSIYAVAVTPSAASSTTVNGSASLTGGTVQAIFAPGSYVARRYGILHASSGLTGTFAGLAGLPAGFSAQLSYTANDVSLDLTAIIGALSPGGLSDNQRHVADALNAYFNDGGALPPGFIPLFGLTGANLANALSQSSGEAATGAQQGAFDMMNSFLGLMTEPSIEGRESAAARSLGFASEQTAMPADVGSAYAAVFKAAPAKAGPIAPHWSAWGSAFGGAGRLDGDAVVGSHDLSARTAGVAAGADYRVTPSTTVGFALAGGGTNWSLTQGLGGGRSDAFMAGAHARISTGPAYVAASSAFANHWMSTDRTSFASDQLTARFNAQSYGGRLETGYRLDTGLAAATPYAAVTAQVFVAPAYSESDPSGGGFGLAYAGRTASDTRAEIGSRFERRIGLAPDNLLMLRGKLGYAHDWVSDPALTAVFQALPGASFVVTGAAPAQDSALASAGAELRFASGWALAARFDGAFAAHSQTYAGAATARFTW